MKKLNFKNDITIPQILANTTITADNSGSGIHELLGLSTSLVLDDGLTIKNDSNENLRIVFADLGDGTDNYVILLGGEQVKINNKILGTIELERTTSNDIDISIYGR